jgi:D-3-phosphoglycerate dehydrogenase
MTKKVFISTSTFAKFDPGPLNKLKSRGFDVFLNPYKREMTSKELLSEATDVVGLIAGTEKIDANVMGKMESLKVISRCGSGLDSVDLTEAKSRRIKVFNTPDAPVIPVVELTIGFMLSLLRNIPAHDTQLHQGIWTKQMGNLLLGKKVGIVGFGKIGQALCKYLKVFGVQIYYFDVTKKKTLKDVQYLPLVKLLETVDIVTLHIALTPQSKNLFNREMLSRLKKGSLLINCARGGIIDEKALYQLLKDKHIAGAALDVFAEEPYTGQLQKLENIILTPHIGTYAKEARIQMELESVDNLLKGFNCL